MENSETYPHAIRSGQYVPASGTSSASQDDHIGDNGGPRGSHGEDNQFRETQEGHVKDNHLHEPPEDDVVDNHLQWAETTQHQQGRITQPDHCADQKLSNASKASSTEWSSDITSSSEDEGGAAAQRNKQDFARSRRFHRKAKSTSETPNSFAIDNDNMKATGKVSKRDGRLKIKFKENTENGYLARILGLGVSHHLGKKDRDDKTHEHQRKAEVDEALSRKPETVESVPRPKLNIVVMVIGSRGDIQPFIKVGKILQDEYGHRVRMATHPAFKSFIEDECGLEFFSVGGDPSELMAFMVKNPGLIPSMQTVREGEVGRRRDQMFEMFQGFWRACINATDDESDPQNKRMLESKYPFVADAIIANPPSFAHVHCAERLGCPLHMMFTFPFSPNRQFPHPLAMIKSSKGDASYANFMSYPLVDMMTWQGLGDLVNRFRVKTLCLDPVSTIWAPGQLYRLKVPYSYMWSPKLCPKPKDWGPEIDISGFAFLELASSFKPPDDLVEFLERNKENPPIYIGFGSIVVDDAKAFTKLIFKAVDKAGVRALVNKGWGGFGDEGHTPDNIHMLGNTPHDWLFPRCAAVVHHGGAGTTAIGLKLAKPTMIVPFFGDQPFWGAMVAEKKAGAHECIPYKQLTVDKLAEGIKQCLTEEAKHNVQKIADSIAAEGDGAENAVKSFHANLPLRGTSSMRCSVLEKQTAVWQVKHSRLRLCPMAAEMLVQQGNLKYHDLDLLRHYEWNDFQGAGDPTSGAGTAVARMVAGVTGGIAGTPYAMGRDIHKHAKHKRKKERHLKRDRERAAMGLPASSGNDHEEDEFDSEIGSSSTSDVDDLGKSSHERQSSAEHKNSKRGSNESKAANDRHAVSHHNNIQNQKTMPESTAKSGETAKKVKNISRPDTQRTDTAESKTSVLSADPEEHIGHQVVGDVAQGIAKPLEAIATFPMDLFMGVAQGFHNLPRLYGDDTVRRQSRVDDLPSGLKAAGEEFVYGTYDAFTGLVTQPYHGAKERGVTGFATGVGKGLSGLVVKEAAAVVGPIGFAMKGVHKEFTKKRTPGAAIRRAREAQGYKELRELSPGEYKDTHERVSNGWAFMQELWAEADRTKRGAGVLGAVKGRFRLEKEKREWEKHGAFESVGMSQKALEAHKRGVRIDEVLGPDSGRRGEKAAQMVDRQTMDETSNRLKNVGTVTPHKGRRADADHIQQSRRQQ